MQQSFLGLICGLALAGTAAAATYNQNFTFPDGTTNFGDGSTAQANAAGAPITGVLGNQLRLADAATGSSQAAYTIPALANARLGWTATFNFSISDIAGGNQPADGFSFNWGSLTLGTVGDGEEGWGAGVPNLVSGMVDLWQNGNAGDPPDVGLASTVSGTRTLVADQDGMVLADGATESGVATITYHPTNGMSFTTTGLLNNANFTNVAVPGFVPSDAYTFGIAARTGGATHTLLIDNMSITTVPEPTGVALLGLGGVGLLLRRRT